jgi:hypothetical protein
VILHFRETMALEGRNGCLVLEHQCVEYPRIFQLQQRADSQAPIVVTYKVEGAASRLQTLDDALDLLRATIEPGEILSVPPLSQRRACS